MSLAGNFFSLYQPLGFQPEENYLTILPHCEDQNPWGAGRILYCKLLKILLQKITDLAELELPWSGWKLPVTLRSADHSSWKPEKGPATQQSTMSDSKIVFLLLFVLSFQIQTASMLFIPGVFTLMGC